MIRALLLMFLALAAPATAEVYELSEADKAAALASAVPQPADPVGTASKRPFLDPHGEVGIVVGSNGLRGIEGSIATTLGDDGFAAFSWESFQNNGRHGGRTRVR